MTNVAAASAWIRTILLVTVVLFAAASGRTAYSASDIPSAQGIDIEELFAPRPVVEIPEDAIIIDMNDEGQFLPREITIDVGQTIAWRNIGLMGHTVTARPGATEDEDLSKVPDDAEPFDSGWVRDGEVFIRTFTTPGLYRYACLPHLRAGMLGTIVVLRMKWGGALVRRPTRVGNLRHWF